MNNRAQRTRAHVLLARAIGIARPRRRIPRQLEPKMIQVEYARAILDLVESALSVALAPIRAELPTLLETAARERIVRDSSILDSRITNDAGEGRRLLELIAAAKARIAETVTPAALEALADRFGRRVAAFNREQLARQTQAALGTDVFVHDANLAALLDGFAAENAALIADIPVKVIADVAALSTRAMTSATPTAQFAEELAARLKVGANRAKLIARDQVGKLYGQVNASRQRALGVTKFIWRTVRDIRVRGTPGGPYAGAEPSHYSREGKTFSYDAPPPDGLPGEPILCRCYAEPVFDDVVA